MVELGNLVFGHGTLEEFKIPRNVGFEEELWLLIHKIKPDAESSYDIPEVITDTFEIRPYYWGDCDCGVDAETNPEDLVSETMAKHKSRGCSLTKPIFLYKPTNLIIEWYKFPFRDSYVNRQITLDEFKRVIDICIKSLVGK